MLILKILYRFFGLYVIFPYIQTNIKKIIKTLLLYVALFLGLAFIGSLTLKFYPNVNIPLHETFTQILNETLQNKLIIIVLLNACGIITISGIVAVVGLSLLLLYFAFILGIIAIYTPKTLINRFKNVLKQVKAENEDHKDAN